MYQFEMSLVFIRILREDEDVVDVHPYEDPQVVSEDIIHDELERRWRITEAEGHNDRLEGAKLRVEGGFLDIFVVDSDLGEPTNKVEPVNSRWIGSMAKNTELEQFAYSTLGSRRTYAIYHSPCSPTGNPLRMHSTMV